MTLPDAGCGAVCARRPLGGHVGSIPGRYRLLVPFSPEPFTGHMGAIGTGKRRRAPTGRERCRRARRGAGQRHGCLLPAYGPGRRGSPIRPGVGAYGATMPTARRPRPQVVVTAVSTKGGTGKTTTVMLLALAAAQAGHQVLVVDGDPQASAMRWAELAGELPGVTVVPMPSTRIDKDLPRAGAGHDVILIDTPPGYGDRRVIESALRAAHLAVVPMAPRYADLGRLVPTLDLSAHCGTPAVVLLGMVTRTRSARELVEVCRSEEVPATVLETVVPATTRIADAFGERTVPGPFPAVWAEVDALALKAARKAARRG